MNFAKQRKRRGLGNRQGARQRKVPYEMENREFEFSRRLARIPPKHTLHIVQDTERINLPLNRVLNLKNKDELKYLQNILSQHGLQAYIEDVNESINFMADKLADEWLTVYPRGVVTVKVAPKRSVGFNLFSDIVPFGLNLKELRNSNSFNNIISRLKVPSHERISTFLEVKAASSYKKAGFDVELEPPRNGGYTDFRVMHRNE